MKENVPINGTINYVIDKRRLRNIESVPCYVAETKGNLTLKEDNSYTILVLMMKYDLIIQKSRYIASVTETPYYQKVTRKFIHQDEVGKNERLQLSAKHRPDSTIAGVGEGTAHKLRPPIIEEILLVDEMFESYKSKLVKLLQEYRDVISVKGEPPG